MKKIAIIGAGFSGLAVAWHLLNQGHAVTLFDPLGPGGGASGVAAGLLHTYAGLHAKMNNQGVEGYQAALNLLEIAEKAMGQKVADPAGLLRIALSEGQEKDYRLTAEKHSDVEWVEAKECVKLAPGVAERPGIFIKSCVTVYSSLYTRGLWTACGKIGGQFETKAIRDLNELKDFDIKIVAMGAMTPHLKGADFSLLNLRPVKGQILELEWPQKTPPLKFPVNSQAYIVMSEDNKRCFVGATYEKNFGSPDVDVEFAKGDILPKATALFPPLKTSAILGCKTGLRSSTPNHLPLLQEIQPNCWVIAGMGSKGLLYHGLYAQKLAIV